MSGNGKKVKKILLAFAAVLSVAVLLLPALLGEGLTIYCGATMAAVFGLPESIKVGPLELLRSGQPFEDCWFHWVMIGAIALYIIMFIIGGAKRKRRLCLVLWIFFTLASLSFAYFTKCEVCLLLNLGCFALVIVTLIALIAIWRRKKVKKNNTDTESFVGENDNPDVYGSRLFATGGSGYAGKLVFLDSDGEGDYTGESEQNEREEIASEAEDDTTTTTTRTIRKVTTITTTHVESDERGLLLERERIEEERKEQERLEHERIEEERLAREAAEKREAAKRLDELNAAEAKKAEDERKAKRAIEIAAENARIETERGFYSSGAAKPPSFKLSREDVLDRTDDMAENLYDYPILTNVRLRSIEKAPDSLRAGLWTFAVMYESKAGVIKFFARMDKRYVLKLKDAHPTITASAFSGSEDWYKVIIDSTYYSKREVFSMIDNWYAYVATRYYSYDAASKKYMTDETAAALAESTVVAAITREIMQPDPDLEKAESELASAEAAMLAAGSLDLAKNDIAKAVVARFGKSVEISQRPNLTRTNLPLADTYYTQGISDSGKQKRVCYAYVYKLKNDSLKIIVKLPRVYAEKQAEIHTNMCRSKFPSGKGWYVSIIDSTYVSETEIYTILARAKSFVESTEERE